MKHKFYRAGFLPYRVINNRIEFLLMKPSEARFGGDQFQIAKGKVEEGEDDLKAALREAYEELGLLEDNVSNIELVGNYLGRTAIFVGRVLDDTKFIEPHFETAETTWMSLHDYELQGRELHLPIIRDAHILANYQLTVR